MCCVAHFQSDAEASTSSATLADSDDVHYRFGGAAICDMLHLRYKQIKSCKDEQRDVLSQEISVLQAMNTKDKTKMPGYLQYQDRGYMYFPDPCFLPCIEKINTLVKGIVNSDGLQQKGDDLIKVSIHQLYVCGCNNCLLHRWHIKNYRRRSPNIKIHSE